jgi:hypothetical protein
MSRAGIVEPPARLVEAAKNVIASTAALAESASATQTASERSAQKSEKERQRLREKKKRAKEKKKQEKASEPPAPAPAARAVIVETPKAAAAPAAASAPPAEAAKGKSAKKPKEDAVVDVLGEPLRAQLPKLLGVSSEEVARRLERGSTLAVVRNGTHVLAFAKADEGEEFVVVSSAVGPATHLRKIVLQLQGESKETKKTLLLPPAVATELALKTSGSFAQLT